MYHAPPMLKKNVVIDWTLFIDNELGVKSEFEDSYEQLTNWIGLNPDVVRLTDFQSQIMASNGSGFRAILNRRETNNIELNSEFWKLFFFHITHTCWHVRGKDLRAIVKNEKIMANAFGLHLPAYSYIDTLKDINKQQINASIIHEGKQDNQYNINDVFNENPFSVIMSLFKSMKMPEEWLDAGRWLIHNPSEYTNATIEKKIQWIHEILHPTWQEYGRGGSCPAIDLFDKSCIPTNWKDFI